MGEVLDMRPGALDELRAMRLGYTHTRGDPALRAAIASMYDGVAADDVLVCAAGEEVIFTFMSAALAPGDHVVVHTPCYQSLIELPRAIGCDVTAWPGRAGNAWAPDLGFLADHVTDRTRAIVVNAPHSPTGFLFDRAEWDELFAIADRHGAIVFSDEAYRGLEHRAEDRLAAACEQSENACSLGLLSKGFGLAGLRIGWAVSRDRALLQRMLEVKDYTTICTSGPGELLATIAIEHADALLERSRAIIRTNLAHATPFFAAHEATFDWIPPRAGSVTFPSLRGGGDPEAFCDRVREAAGVLLLPGTLFDEASTQIRFGLGRRDFPAGLERLDEHLRAGSAAERRNVGGGTPA